MGLVTAPCLCLVEDQMLLQLFQPACFFVHALACPCLNMRTEQARANQSRRNSRPSPLLPPLPRRPPCSCARPAHQALLQAPPLQRGPLLKRRLLQCMPPPLVCSLLIAQQPAEAPAAVADLQCRHLALHPLHQPPAFPAPTWRPCRSSAASARERHPQLRWPGGLLQGGELRPPEPPPWQDALQAARPGLCP